MHASSFGPEAWAPLGKALKAYSSGDRNAVLKVKADEGDPEPMAVRLFFRSRDELREVDREALDRVRGRTLDGGAGVGSLSLILQEDGVPVTAVEVVPQAVEIMVERGVGDVRAGRMEDLPGTRTFDTVLLLMNGAALAGSLRGLPALFTTLDGLLAPGGQVLMDSTDLLQGGAVPGRSDPPVSTEGFLTKGVVSDESVEWGEAGYPGELQYQMEFRGERGAPFPQLFVDPGTLLGIAGEHGWRGDVVWCGEGGEYLARLVRAGEAGSE